MPGPKLPEASVRHWVRTEAALARTQQAGPLTPAALAMVEAEMLRMQQREDAARRRGRRGGPVGCQLPSTALPAPLPVAPSRRRQSERQSERESASTSARSSDMGSRRSSSSAVPPLPRSDLSHPDVRAAAGRSAIEDAAATAAHLAHIRSQQRRLEELEERLRRERHSRSELRLQLDTVMRLSRVVAKHDPPVA